jgi:ABC-type polysaccharide/polyol phosphate export permease
MDVKKYLELSLGMAKVDIKTSNEGSYLGTLWYIITPILMFAVILLIFTDRLGQGIESYPAYLLVGIMMFNFFQESTKQSTRVVKIYRVVIKSMNFPRVVLPASANIRFLFSHMFEIAILAALLVMMGLSPLTLIMYPPILVLLVIFSMGFSLFLSAATVYLPDLDNIWRFGSYLLWLATPIFYDIGGQTKLLFFNMFNPMYFYITAARDVIVYSTFPDIWIISGMVFYSALSIVIGVLLFSRLKDRFAEMV